MITCRNTYYVKLGRKGSWEEDSIKNCRVRIGWSQQQISDIHEGNWKKIQKELIQESKDKGTATRDYNALRMFCESTPDDIWITFHKSHLWWCRMSDSKIGEDSISKYREVSDWQNKDIFGTPLLITEISGKLTKVQGFKGTICTVKEKDYLVRLINKQYSPEYKAIEHSQNDLCQRVIRGIQTLHWKDFETLVDLIFRGTGWRRVSVLGESMKYSDIELEEQITGDMYQVQVKSSASLADYQEYADNFPGGKYKKLFFVVHSPDKRLLAMTQHNTNVELMLADSIAELTVNLGLVNWLMGKIK